MRTSTELIGFVDEIADFARVDPLRAEAWLEQKYGSIENATRIMERVRTVSEQVERVILPLAGKTDTEILAMLDANPRLLHQLADALPHDEITRIFSDDRININANKMDLGLVLSGFYSIEPNRTNSSPSFAELAAVLSDYGDRARASSDATFAAQRAEEYLADRYAIRHVSNPDRYFGFLQEMTAVEQQARVTDFNALSGYDTSTHPEIPDRIAAGQAFLATQPQGRVAEFRDMPRQPVRGMRMGVAAGGALAVLDVQSRAGLIEAAYSDGDYLKAMGEASVGTTILGAAAADATDVFASLRASGVVDDVARQSRLLSQARYASRAAWVLTVAYGVGEIGMGIRDRDLNRVMDGSVGTAAAVTGSVAGARAGAATRNPFGIVAGGFVGGLAGYAAYDAVADVTVRPFFEDQGDVPLSNIAMNREISALFRDINDSRGELRSEIFFENRDAYPNALSLLINAQTYYITERNMEPMDAFEEACRALNRESLRMLDGDTLIAWPTGDDPYDVSQSPNFRGMTASMEKAASETARMNAVGSALRRVSDNQYPDEVYNLINAIHTDPDAAALESEAVRAFIEDHAETLAMITRDEVGRVIMQQRYVLYDDVAITDSIEQSRLQALFEDAQELAFTLQMGSSLVAPAEQYTRELAERFAVAPTEADIRSFEPNLPPTVRINNTNEI